MPAVVVATMTAKPESVDAGPGCVQEQAIEAVHREPGLRVSTRCTRPTGPSCSSSSGLTLTR